MKSASTNSTKSALGRSMCARGQKSLVLWMLVTGCGGSTPEADDASDETWGNEVPPEDTEWERDWSAGEVGCAPREIEVQDMKGLWGNKTWSATCQGRVYHCTSRQTGGIYGSDQDVSCTLAGGSSGRAAVATGPKEPEWATSALPTQAVGYIFGNDVETVARTCVEARNTWNQEEKQFRCSGLPVDIGLPGQSTAAFCGGKLCVVTAYLWLSVSKQAEQCFEVIAADLVKKYGAPTRQRRIKELTCEKPFIQCVEQAEASWEAIWNWKSGELLRATTLAKDGKAFLAIRYQMGESDGPRAAEPQRNQAPVDTSAF